MGLFNKKEKEKEQEEEEKKEEKNPKNFSQFAKQYMQSADKARVACCRTCGKPLASCRCSG